MRNTLHHVDRFLIDRADEVVQDLVASFSAQRLTTPLRLSVLALYLLALLHLLFVVLLPWYRGTIATVIGRGLADASPAQVTAFATGIVVGGVSFHVLMTVASVLLSFLVRAAKMWTRSLGVLVLLGNGAVAWNALATPVIARVFVVLNVGSLMLATLVIIFLGAAEVSRSRQHRVR